MSRPIRRKETQLAENGAFRSFKEEWLKIESAGGSRDEKLQLTIESKWIHWMTEVQAARFAPSPQEVEDIASETLIRLCTKVRNGSFNYDSTMEIGAKHDPFRGWWVVSIERAAIDASKPFRKRRELLLENENEIIDGRARANESGVDVVAAIMRLEGREKAVMVASYLTGESVSTIAQRLGVSTKTVSRAVQSARAKLRLMLDIDAE